MRFLVLLSALLVSATSMATTLVTKQTEVLNNVEINGKKTNYVARLTLDFVRNEMAIEVFQDPCGQLQPALPGIMRCMAEATLVDTISASIVGKDTSCGSSIYTGFRDEAELDGLRVNMEVIDHRTRMCKDVVPSPIMVNATVYSPFADQETRYYLTK